MFGHQDDQPQDDSNQDQQWQHPGEPIVSNEDLPSGAPPVQPETINPEHADHSSAPTIQPLSSPPPLVGPADSNPDVTDDLIDIKQKALGQLSPLLNHLDQSPEEKFRTLMMMIQASDDQTLVKEAYALVESIQDEKTKAQALLDIVNEINYFTSQHKS